MYEEELKELFTVSDVSTPLGQRNQAILELLYATGMRVSELCSLKESDLDLSMDTVLVHGKGSKQRYVPFGSYAHEALITYLEDGRQKLKAKGKDRADTHVFLNQRGTPLTDRGVRFILTELMASLLPPPLGPFPLSSGFVSFSLLFSPCPCSSFLFSPRFSPEFFLLFLPLFPSFCCLFFRRCLPLPSFRLFIFFSLFLFFPFFFPFSLSPSSLSFFLSLFSFLLPFLPPPLFLLPSSLFLPLLSSLLSLSFLFPFSLPSLFFLPLFSPFFPSLSCALLKWKRRSLLKWVMSAVT
ncbi:Tyrosine recombinase XerC [Bacillus safensis subsp. safensis]